MQTYELANRPLFGSDEWPVTSPQSSPEWGFTTTTESTSDSVGGGARSKTRPPTDLYFWWAQLVGFRASKPVSGSLPTRFSFIAEGNFDAFKKEFTGNKAMVFWDEYTRPINRDRDESPSAFFTFDLHVGGNGSSIDTEALREMYRRLVHSKNVKRLQFGFPRGEGGRVQGDTSKRQPLPAAAESSAKNPQTEANVVLGVIDDGAAFGHASVCEVSTQKLKSRVSLIWNQTRESHRLNERHWTSRKEAGWHGGELESEKIAELIDEHSSGSELDELACYSALFDADATERALRGRESHGAAVMTTMAGRFGAAGRHLNSVRASSGIAETKAVDKASEAPIIFVELPYEHIAISSGRWMPISALDGVRYIIARARERFRGSRSPRVPVVINISSGSNTGPHDGTSMIESAFAEILESDPWVAITVAAGNSRLTGTHVDVVVPPNASNEIVVRVPPRKKFETYAEFWPQWERPENGSIPLDYSSVTFDVKSPTGEVQKSVKFDDSEAVFRDVAKQVLAGFRSASDAVQAKNRPMALLVVSATAPHEFLSNAPYGNWVVRCNNRSNVPLRIKAWVERDEIVFGVRQPQHARFASTGAEPPARDNWSDESAGDISRRETTSNMANTAHVFAVAAGTGDKGNGFVSPYSGGGDGGVRPQLIARADRNPAQPGILVWGNYRGARRHMNGTSIAAPQAARWIANCFANGIDRTHLECLTMHAQPRSHPHLRGIADGEGRLFIDSDEMPDPSTARGCAAPQNE